MQKKWKINEPVDNDKVKHLSQILNVSEAIASMLVRRNIFTFDQAKAFFRPNLNDLYNPFLLLDMDKAINRIIFAFENNQKILIYGDYDVDGTTAVAVMYSCLSKYYNHIEFYIPDRYKEGYGISIEGIDYALKNECKLMITLDCGINAFNQINYANTNGLDIIVTDHHNQSDTLPEAYAIVNPKRYDCKYPFKDLSGCGVGFKLLQALYQKQGYDMNKLYSYLDLIAVSITSDIVSVTDENRIFMFYGLKLINTQPRLAIRSILKYTGINPNINFNPDNPGKETYFDREINVTEIGFIIGPRINAAGRIDNAGKVIELLINEINIEESERIAGLLNDDNSDRKDIEKNITAETIDMISENDNLINRKTTVLYNPGWHKGVIGIVASRIQETYYRPTILFTSQDDQMLTGSARSVKGFNIYDAISKCSHLLVKFGGHHFAAGITIKKNNLESFSDLFEQVVSNSISDEMLIPSVDIESEIQLKDINYKFYRILKQFSPFGIDNPSPVFVSRNVSDKGFARIVGNNHLKFDSLQKGNESAIASIAFNLGDHMNKIFRQNRFSICYSVEENVFNNQKKLQLLVKDIRFE
ncbi:MAG: single-stranded-DNA-specific exonuclease RecJ [Bacteroidota bacterium]|nr:single-stranded-DNA-specific exonuclease RecJ [Bacteroidota bacterium]